MLAPRRFLPVLAIAAWSCLALCAGNEPTPASGDSGFETALAAHLRESVDHYATGDYERSLEAAEAALALTQQQSAIAYNNICSAKMRLGALEEAAAACTKALERLPGYDRAWSNLAWVYERQAAQTPTVGAYLNLSVAYYWRDDLPRSIGASRKALELDANSAVAHNNLCAAHAKGGDWTDAVRECRLALKLVPDYARAKNNLAWATTKTIDAVR